MIPDADHEAVDPRQAAASTADALVKNTLTLLHMELRTPEEIIHGAMMAIVRYYAEGLLGAGSQANTSTLYANLGTVLRNNCIRMGEAIAAVTAPDGAPLPANMEWRGLDFYVNGQPYGFVFDEPAENGDGIIIKWRVNDPRDEGRADTIQDARTRIVDRAMLDPSTKSN